MSSETSDLPCPAWCEIDASKEKCCECKGAEKVKRENLALNRKLFKMSAPAFSKEPIFLADLLKGK